MPVNTIGGKPLEEDFVSPLAGGKLTPLGGLGHLAGPRVTGMVCR